MPDNVLIATANDANGAHQKIVNEYLDAGGLPVSVSMDNPLPVAAVINTTGLATSSAQTTANITLASIDSKLTNPLPIVGTVNTGLTQPLTDAQLRAIPLPVSITGGGDATAANQVAQTAKLTSIDGKTPALGQALATASTPVVLTAVQLSALTPTPAISGFATADKQDLLLSELQLKADLTDTQPVSVATLPLPTGAATSANQQTDALTNTQLRATPIPVSITSDIQIGAVELKNATTDDRVAIVNITPTTEFGVVTRNIPSGTQAVSVATLPLPTGAAIAANQQTNAITNAEIRATTLPVSLASTTITGTVSTNTILAVETTKVIGTVNIAASQVIQANAGTNLNTSALALESGNLSTIKTNTDKIPALGQALAVGSVPVVLTASQLTTITPPAAISGFATSAKQDLLLTELQLKADLTETQPVSIASVPSHPVTNAGTFATQAVLAAETTKVIGTVNVAGTVPISGSVTSNIGTTNGLALDTTLTGGTQKSVIRGGSKGSTVAADVTSTIVDANTQALDVSIKGTVSTGGLTDAQLRATALPISGNITANIGTTNGLALDTSINTLLKPASTLAAVTSITNTVTIKADTLTNQVNALKVDGSATTQPISGTVTANTGLLQPLTDAQIRATPLLVAGTRSNDGTTSATGANHVTVGGSDGTSLKPLLTDSTGKLNVVGKIAIDQTTNIIAATTMQNAAVALGNGVNLNVQGYVSAIISLTGTMSSNTAITFEVSSDDTTFVPIVGHQIGVAGALVSTTTNIGDFRFNVAGYKSLRARVSVFGTGSITAKGYVSTLAGHSTTVNSNIIASLPVGTNSIGSVVVPSDADTASTGTLTAATQTVVLIMGGKSASAVSISGTWVGTITFEGSVDGTIFNPINAVAASTSQPQPTTTVNGLYRLSPAGLLQIRAIMTTYTSGTANISMRASAGTGAIFANQILPSKITDGTNTATIKSASTASVATDLPLVVALHPSSTTPNFATAQSVTGAFFQATQPISGTISSINNSLVSTVNSTAVALAANAVFTGTSEDVSEYSTVMITVFSDQVSAIDGLSIQQSSNGTNWDLADAYSIPISTGKIFSTGVQARFLRIVYTNGTTTSTVLRLQTLYSKESKKNSSVRPQDGRTNDNDFEEELSFLMGYNSLANSWNRVGITSGNLGGNETLLDRLKVNASLRMIDTSQAVGSQLVGATGTQALGLTVNTVDRPARLLGVLSAGTNKIGSVDSGGAVNLTTTSASALNADVIVSTDVSAFKAVSLQLTGTWTGAIAFQGSNDNITFNPIISENITSNTSQLITSTSGLGVFLIPIKFKFLRVRMTVFTSGTATGVAIAYSDDRNISVNNVALNTGANTIGAVQQRGVTVNSNTLSTLNSVAGTNATLLKATAGTVYTINAMNASAALRYVRIYNLATAPTVGTSIPVTVIAIPATSSKEVQFSIGMPFTAGISYSITAGATATDATAVVAGDVQLAISWI